MESGKILVVGMNPSSREKRTKSSALSRLDDWMKSIRVDEFTFTNAVLTPGKVSKRMVDGDRVKSLCALHRKVIALGRFSSEVLTSLEVDHFRLPHPSGLNRMINDEEFIRSQLRECQHYLSK